MISEKTLRLLSSNALTALSNMLTRRLASNLNKKAALASKLSKMSNTYIQIDQGTKVEYASNVGFDKGPKSLQDNLKVSLDAMKEVASLQTSIIKNDPSLSKEDVILADNEIAALVPVTQESSNSSIYLGNKIRDLKFNVSNVTQTIETLHSALQGIDEVLDSRSKGLTPEPNLNIEDINLDALPEGASAALKKYETLIVKGVTKPTSNSKNANRAATIAQLKASEKSLSESARIDSVYGPPVTKNGKFLLSQDGIYYNSQQGGIPEIDAVKILSNSWKGVAYPNEGGKGEQITTKSIESFSNSVFSEDFTDTNSLVVALTENDDVITSYEATLKAHVRQINTEVSQLVASGFNATSITVMNHKKTLGSVAAIYQDKITKRKKQLQLAGLFGDFEITDSSFAFGKDLLLQTLSKSEYSHEFEKRGYKSEGSDIPGYNDTGLIVLADMYILRLAGEELSVKRQLERVPVNNFSYLKGSGLVPSLGRQRKLVIAGEQHSVVLPVKPVFLESNNAQEGINASKVSVDIPSPADIMSFNSSAGVSSTNAFVKSLGEGVETDNLLLCYNFQETEVVAPGATKYTLKNMGSAKTSLDGKMVASSTSYIFPSGISVPFLRGSLYDPGLKYGSDYNSSGGAYIRLPNTVKDGEIYPGGDKLSNLLYSKDGWSMDFWVHVPGLSSTLETSHRYKLVAACENSGRATESQDDFVTSWYDNDDAKVKGLVIGFRDKGVSGHLSDDSNGGGDGLEFIISPTVGQNPNDYGYSDQYKKWGHSIAIAEKSIKSSEDVSVTLTDPDSSVSPASGTQLGIIIPLSKQTSSGKSIGSCSGEYSHYSMAFDYSKDSATVFLDGEELTTCSISTAFNVNAKAPLQIPSPAVLNSSRTENSYTTKSGHAESLYEGMEETPLYPVTTPWILGGGFSDSIGAEPGVDTTPAGFLGYNTNDQYATYTTNVLNKHSNGGVIGQHTESMGGLLNTSGTRRIQRSGLDGFVGSFKVYTKPLTSIQNIKNYNAQKGYFKNITT
jgi:hypothetical protein